MNPLTLAEARAAAIDHIAAGRLREAEALCRAILGTMPRQPDALHLLGVVALRAGRLEIARDLIERAIAVNAHAAEPRNSLALVLNELGEFEQAAAAAREAVARDPGFSEAHMNLARALNGLGQLAESTAAAGTAFALNPTSAAAAYNLGNALYAERRYAEAGERFRQALALDPGSAPAANNLGNALRESAQWAGAEEAYRHALALDPGSVRALNNLSALLVELGRPEEAVDFMRRAIAARPDDAAIHSNLILCLHYLPGIAPAEIAREQTEWDRRHARPLEPFRETHRNSPDPDRRLRIGYVSPHFRDHILCRCVLPLLRRQDHEQFEIFCYSNAATHDATSELVRSLADHWREVQPLDDAGLAAQIRADGIDILVDLTQHMESNRLPLFGLKPAPVQFSFAGYPADTGVNAIDYRISDRHLEAASAKVPPWCLLESFWCYESAWDIAPNAPPSADAGFVTFGCLNSFGKVNAPTLALWARVLVAVERSKLLLLARPGPQREWATGFLAQNGIEPGRVEFAEPRPAAEYLKLYHRVDVALDTAPYNGHTTSLDALWMGVPVVSLAGSSSVARAGVSQLTNIGAPELIAFSEDEFVAIARELAGDPGRLASFRRELRGMMERSPIMDGPRFARAIESACRQAWRRWCEGQRSTP